MKLIKLLLGSIFFIALCGSGMMLLVLFLGLSEGYLNARSLVSLLISASVFFASSISLYYLSRETPEAEPSETSKKFKSRKLKLQLLAITLITIFILSIIFIAGTTDYAQAEGAIITAIFFGLYIQLAKRLWRCPACETQLPFMNEYKDRQSIKSCPSCNTQLQ